MVMQGARAGFVGDDEKRADPRVDRRRHWISEKRFSFRPRRPPILRAVRQAGQLSGRRFVVGGQRTRQPSRRLSPVSAERLGLGPRKGAPRPASRTTLSSRPSLRSRSTGFERRWRPGFGKAWFSPGYGNGMRFRCSLKESNLD